LVICTRLRVKRLRVEPWSAHAQAGGNWFFAGSPTVRTSVPSRLSKSAAANGICVIVAAEASVRIRGLILTGPVLPVP
jgi:hypothetical protein